MGQYPRNRAKWIRMEMDLQWQKMQFRKDLIWGYLHFYIYVLSWDTMDFPSRQREQFAGVGGTLRSHVNLIVGIWDLCERRDGICSSQPLVRAALGSNTAWFCCQDNTHRAQPWGWAWPSLMKWRQVRLVLSTLKRGSILLASKLARDFKISFNSLTKSLSSAQYLMSMQDKVYT